MGPDPSVVRNAGRAAGCRASFSTYKNAESAEKFLRASFTRRAAKRQAGFVSSLRRI
jgi:hypothetical protein